MPKNIGQWHYYENQNYLVKLVKPENRFEKYDGWAISLDLLRQVDDGDTILLAEMDSEDAFYATRDDFKNGQSILVHYPGQGAQRVLPRKYWHPFPFNLYQKILKA